MNSEYETPPSRPSYIQMHLRPLLIVEANTMNIFFKRLSFGSEDYSKELKVTACKFSGPD